jgi:hypothetical protein
MLAACRADRQSQLGAMLRDQPDFIVRIWEKASIRAAAVIRKIN